MVHLIGYQSATTEAMANAALLYWHGHGVDFNGSDVLMWVRRVF